jgi:hypothetical protein
MVVPAPEDRLHERDGRGDRRVGAPPPSYEVRTSSDSMKVTRKTAGMALVIRLRTKIRTTRGLNCPLAICTVTSEVLNTTPMKVIIA